MIHLPGRVEELVVVGEGILDPEHVQDVGQLRRRYHAHDHLRDFGVPHGPEQRLDHLCENAHLDS